MTQHHSERYDQANLERLAQRYRRWGKWGLDDELGAANFITADKVVEASRCINRGVTFSLSLPLLASGPQRALTSRVNPQHLMLRTPHDPVLGAAEEERFTDDAVYMPLQSSTQWDALCHAFYAGSTYNDRGPDSITTAGGAEYNSITNLQERAVSRGVLLDVARHRGVDWLAPGDSISSAELLACATAQNVEVRSGDYLLIRTGQLAWCRATEQWDQYCGGAAPGLGIDAVKFVFEREVAGVATDTWGVEVRPQETNDLKAPVHMLLLVNAGVYMGEMWDLDALAADCASDAVFEFFLAAQPLNVVGAVGSPVNPIAVK